MRSIIELQLDGLCAKCTTEPKSAIPNVLFNGADDQTLVQRIPEALPYSHVQCRCHSPKGIMDRPFRVFIHIPRRIQVKPKHVPHMAARRHLGGGKPEAGATYVASYTFMIPSGKLGTDVGAIMRGEPAFDGGHCARIASAV